MRIEKVLQIDIFFIVPERERETHTHRREREREEREGVWWGVNERVWPLYPRPKWRGDENHSVSSHKQHRDIPLCRLQRNTRNTNSIMVHKSKKKKIFIWTL